MSPGAIVLKNVVLNSAGGFDELLGYRLDRQLLQHQIVTTPSTGQVIPELR